MYGVNSQGALSQGTPAEVEADVRQCIRTLAPGGGYVLGPDNSIVIPEANYRAYLEAGERTAVIHFNSDERSKAVFQVA